MNDDIKKLTDRLNACKHPRKIYNALSMFASSADARNAENPRAAIFDALNNIDCQKMKRQED